MTSGPQQVPVAMLCERVKVAEEQEQSNSDYFVLHVLVMLTLALN